MRSCCLVLLLLLVASPAFAETFEISITASDVDARAYIDDDETPVPLPATLRREPGVMHLRVVAPDRRVYEAKVDIGEGLPTAHHADLMPLTRLERDALARHRSLGITRSVMFWSGLALIGAGLIVFALPAPDSPAQDGLYRRFVLARNRAEADRLYGELRANANTSIALQTTGWVVLSVGAAAAITWGLLALLTPDQPPRTAAVQVGIGPGGLAVFGSF